MTAETWLVALAVAVLLVWLALARANRIDLLHQKVTRTAATLDAQLLRRAALSAELAVSGELDPASGLLVADAANACLAEAREDVEADPALRSGSGGRRRPPALPGRVTLTEDRETVESDLSRVLRQAMGEVGDDGVAASAGEGTLAGDLVATWRRVTLARRFYNEAVAQAVRVRSQPISRLLRLAGRARMPRMFEMDDTLP
ncbi:hypothetical protein [Miniimonas sp. S16]|uniref:hypothetical protein n=1 Tax=Miniimonas sp. S16 TaxID=2171623 RepID=UPI000D52626D|nr:hypothetical protein [Miniimonas sp. S16]